MSTPPNASIVRETSRFRSAGFVTSPRTASAPSRSASRSSSSRRRANIATFAPSAASASAIARPMPEEAPQTIAVRPLRSRSTGGLSARGAEHADDLANGLGGRVERLALVVTQVELDDLLDAARAELDGNAHVQAVDPVLALE